MDINTGYQRTMFFDPIYIIFTRYFVSFTFKSIKLVLPS